MQNYNHIGSWQGSFIIGICIIRHISKSPYDDGPQVGGFEGVGPAAEGRRARKEQEPGTGRRIADIGLDRKNE